MFGPVAGIGVCRRWVHAGPVGRIGFDQDPATAPGGPARVSYRATLDVPESTARTLSGWLAAHRKRTDARPWQRAASCWTQTVLVLRWFIQGADARGLARDCEVFLATAYRYLHEATRRHRRALPGPDRDSPAPSGGR